MVRAPRLPRCNSAILGRLIAEGVSTVSGGFLGAILAGAPGAAWGLAIAFVPEAMMWWVRFDGILLRTNELRSTQGPLLVETAGGRG